MTIELTVEERLTRLEQLIGPGTYTQDHIRQLERRIRELEQQFLVLQNRITLIEDDVDELKA